LAPRSVVISLFCVILFSSILSTMRKKTKTKTKTKENRRFGENFFQYREEKS
jgi:hypothetical protein